MPLANQGGRQQRPNLSILHTMAVELGADGLRALADQMRATVEAETGKPHAWWHNPLTLNYHLVQASPVYVRPKPAEDSP